MGGKCNASGSTETKKKTTRCYLTMNKRKVPKNQGKTYLSFENAEAEGDQKWFEIIGLGQFEFTNGKVGHFC